MSHAIFMLDISYEVDLWASPSPVVLVHPSVNEIGKLRIHGKQLVSVGWGLIVIWPLHIKIGHQALGKIFI